MAKNRPFIIAEIGCNHNGDLEEAKSLVRQAASANCWGVKFQFRNVSTFYQSSNEIGDEILSAEIARTDLAIKDLVSLADLARSLGMKSGMSFFRVEDYRVFGPACNSFDFFKVPSAECTNYELIKSLLETKKQVMVSTGGHSVTKIEDTLTKFIDKNLIIFHCVPNYPTKLGAQNLLFINKLKELGFKDVGYSSHDEDIEVCLMAMAIGAKWIERHLTNDVNGKGLDDSSSSEIKDFKLLDKYARNMSDIMGDKNRLPNQGEILNMQNLGTGMYAKKHGTNLLSHSLSDFEIKAPRVGMSVGEYLQDYKDKPLFVNLNKGEALSKRHFTKVTSYNKDELSVFAKQNLVGIPVRLHDIDKYRELINTGVYEFHLSYTEVFSEGLLDSVSKVNKDDHISIHLPDYLEGNRIVDPISTDPQTRSDSRELIKRTQEFAKYISDKINKHIPIIGSFSQRCGRKREEVLEDLFNYLGTTNANEYKIYPQWLPVYAWYFGGSVKLDLFNHQEDIDYVNKHQLDVTLDLCHLSLSAEYSKESWLDWYNQLKGRIGHFHLADAEGVDGEGLDIGSGNIGDFSIFLDSEKIKVIEVWQGHFHDGVGFLKALDTLNKQKQNWDKATKCLS